MSNLDDDIDVQCGVVGALTCQQIANPHDSSVLGRLAKARADLLVMQQKRADEMSSYFEKNRIRPLEDDIAFMRKLRAIREKYECEAAYAKPVLEWAEYYNPVRVTAEDLGVGRDIGRELMFVLSGARFDK